MKVSFHQHIGIFEKGLPSSYCDKLINAFYKHKNKHLNRQDEHDFINKNYAEKIGVDPASLPKREYGEKEDTTLYLNHEEPALTKEVASILVDEILPIYVSKYINERVFNGLHISEIRVQKTLPTEGYHIWHCEHDVTAINNLERVLAYTIYLNDVEEGGETEFLFQSKRVKSTKGTVCIFPAYFTHMHRGNPPLEKAKYIATGWVTTDLSLCFK